MNNKYAFQGLKENMARALARDVEISTKVAIETANFLRGKTTEKAIEYLDRVLAMEQAIPFKRFTDGVGHRKGAGIGAGRFPQKASMEFKKLIESAEANAQAKGLSTELKIVGLTVNKGSNQFHSGRLSRRKYKRTHLEIVVEEMEVEKKPAKKANKKHVVKSTQKSESQIPKKTETIAPKKEEPAKEEKKTEIAKPVKEEIKSESKEAPENKEKPKPVERKTKEKPAEKKTEEIKAESKPAPAEKTESPEVKK